MSLIGQSIGNYRIVAKLGEGGMGAVYLGEHPLIGKRVAIKVLLDELAGKEDIVQRFFNEAKAVNDIGHPNIVDIVDFGRTFCGGAEITYFVMEYLEGEHLGARLQRQGLTHAETLHVIAQCCSALAASHQKGIVHRDLKPENIYLISRGADPSFVKLLDFGIAKLTGDGGTSSKTRTGLVIGTPAYMSPEQCEGKGRIDHRSDVYSLGVVMYELLTGRVPFLAEGFGEVLVAHLTRDPDRPSRVNPRITPAVEAIVLRALEKDRNRRFQTMDEFLRAVRDPEGHVASYRPLPARAGGTLLLDDASPVMTAAPREPQPTTLSGAAVTVEGTVAPPRRSRAPLALGLSAALLLAGGGATFFLTQRPTPAVAPPAPPPVVVDDTVTITVRSTPPGARVERADRGYVGSTPLDLTLKKGEAAFDIRLVLDGFRQTTSTVTSERTQVIDVTLAAEAPPPPPPVVADATPEKPEVTKRSRPRPRTRPKTDDKPAAVDPEMGLLRPSFLDK